MTRCLGTRTGAPGPPRLRGVTDPKGVPQVWGPMLPIMKSVLPWRTPNHCQSVRRVMGHIFWMAVRNSKVCPQNRNYLLSKRRVCVSTVLTGAIGPTSVRSHECAALMGVRGSTRSCCIRHWVLLLLLIRTTMPLQLSPTLLKLAGLLRQVTLLAQLRQQGSRQLCP